MSVGAQGAFVALVPRHFGDAVGSIGGASGRLSARLSYGTPALRDGVGAEWPELSARATLVLYADGALVDVTERDEFLGPVTPTAASVETWSEPMAALLRAWSHALSRRLHLALSEFADRAENPAAIEVLDRVLFPFPVPLGLALWATEGPAPVRPERFADPEPVVARLADLLAESPGLGTVTTVRDALVTLCFGPWRFVLAGRADAYPPLDGEFWVVTPEGAAAMVAMRTIDGAQSHTILAYDGDTVTLRGVLHSIARAVERAGLDVELSVETEDDDEPYATMLTSYLRGRDDEAPQIDWRVQGDAVGDGPLRDGYDPALRRGNEATSLVWDRFVRALFDPAYEPREGAPYALRYP